VYKELCGDTLAQARRGKVYDGSDASMPYDPSVECTVRVQPVMGEAADDEEDEEDLVLVLNFTRFDTYNYDYLWLSEAGEELWGLTVRPPGGYNVTGLVVAMPGREAELRFATAPASRGDWGQASRSGWALEYDLLPRMEAEQLNGLLLDDAAVEALGRAVRANGGIYRGSLVIGGANVTTLAPLAGLREVRGSLQLMRTAVPTLRGVESLAAIGGDLEISGCDALETLEGLQGLHAVGFDVEIWYNEGLRDISPLLNLESIGGRLEVRRNKELDSLQGLGSVKRIGEDLVINSENLTDVGFLGSLERVEGDGETFSKNNGGPTHYDIKENGNSALQVELGRALPHPLVFIPDGADVAPGPDLARIALASIAVRQLVVSAVPSSPQRSVLLPVDPSVATLVHVARVPLVAVAPPRGPVTVVAHPLVAVEGGADLAVGVDVAGVAQTIPAKRFGPVLAIPSSAVLATRVDEGDSRVAPLVNKAIVVVAGVRRLYPRQGI